MAWTYTLIYNQRNGFDTIDQILKTVETQCPIYTEDIEQLRRHLDEARTYLNVYYKMHIKFESRIQDHCIKYALTDKSNPTLYESCSDHTHTEVYCDSCRKLSEVLNKVQNFVNEVEVEQEEKSRMLHQVGVAINHIDSYKKHVIRIVHQERVKNEIFDDMPNDERSVFCIMDWAMKWLPRAARESQAQWFGKVGVSYHITVCYVHRRNTAIFQRTYVPCL